MSDGIRGLSLLPFLERNPGTFHLRFPLSSQDPEALAHSSFPFLLISDSDPTARVVAARVDTDGGDRVASLFFLVQKDRYRLEKETLHPVTNVEVEKAWQRAGAAYRTVGEGCAPRFFEGQSGANGILSPFAPLFFCKEKRKYFHPPCPRCGRPLALCADDAVLAAAGLPLYSASLERHLFCEACAGSAGGNFYAVEAGSGSPAVLRDRISLVREFGRVGGGSSCETGFPCPACPEREECFGPSLKALARIVPFSFYPFHAFAFDAMSLCGPDFLALLSGAGAETLAKRLESAGERGRAALVRAAGDASPLLFERGERRFLEILYLKLSLLGELFDSLPSGERPAGPPEFRPSVDRAWVALGAARNLLPRYWNFRAIVLDIGRYGEEDASGPGVPGRDDLSFFGVAWFEALLANAKQDGVAVRRALSERLRHPPQGEASPFHGALDPGSPFFQGNIFFEPEAASLSEGTAELWNGALAAGWSILLAGAGKETGKGRESITSEIRSLRARVRERLFEDATPAALPASGAQERKAGPAAQPRMPGAPETGDDADAAIAGILDAILRKWSADASAAGAPPPRQPKASPPRQRPAPPAGDDFMVKTVVLGAQSGPPRAAGAPLIASDPAPAPREPAMRPPAAPAPTAAPDDTMEKTMILRSGNGTPAPSRTAAPPPAPPPAADDFLDRTVILGPGKSGVVPPAPEKAKDAKEPEPPPAGGPDAGFDLEKTVIIKAPPDAGKIRRHGR
ncbi:MAG: hypothetical protein B7Z62_01575 [Deltaproteobacteria bacterium 37-65-8]|nr:MAG: hypothetical protein B7Z62_01575 [Deltaproteobacteria bacterium 37-65-8]HQT96327.1 hypothetical protein [Thermodesulfobacteriota bacterium]